MTKRFAPLLAAALLALSLCACTDNTVDTPSNGTGNGNVSTTPNGTVNGTGDMTDYNPGSNSGTVTTPNNGSNSGVGGDNFGTPDNAKPGSDDNRNESNNQDTPNYPDDLNNNRDDVTDNGAEDGSGIVGRARRALDNAGRSFRDSMN